MDRRGFLSRAGAVTAGLVAGCGDLGSTALLQGSRHPSRPDETAPLDPSDWASVRAQFALPERPIDLAALFIAGHPRPVRDAIDEHRRGLDRSPTRYLLAHDDRLTREARAAAGGYLGGDASEVALTDSTTMGLGLLYNGLRLRAGDELLTTEHDYYVTHAALRLAAERSGATVRKIGLYDSIENVSAQQIVGRIVAALAPRTRVLALTWVHSGTGLKIPVRAIADAIEGVNRERADEDRILVGLDAVHGFGVEVEPATELGCDFFAAGTHKWVFGPRGTGVLWGRSDAWARTLPTIPSFIDSASWSAWYAGREPAGPTTAARVTPGGFKPFEHRWAMPAAFDFHERIGRERVRDRTHALAGRLKEGLVALPGVRLVTPMGSELSSGIVCFEVDGLSADVVVSRLGDRGIVATVTPYATEYARLAPSIRNSPEEVDAAVEAVAAL